jgi:hypothetical protein
LNGFFITASFSHKKEMGSEKHTADMVLPGGTKGYPAQPGYTRCTWAGKTTEFSRIIEPNLLGLWLFLFNT